MATEFYTLSDTGDGLCRVGEPEVMQFDLVTTLQRALKKPDVSLAAQRALQRKRLAAAEALVHLFEQQSAGLHRAGAGFERRKSTGNFIGVEEAETLHFLGQKLFCECGLARAVAAGDEVDGWLQCPSSYLPVACGIFRSENSLNHVCSRVKSPASSSGSGNGTGASFDCECS